MAAVKMRLVLFPMATLNLILCNASITFREINLNTSMRSVVCVAHGCCMLPPPHALCRNAVATWVEWTECAAANTWVVPSSSTLPSLLSASFFQT